MWILVDSKMWILVDSEMWILVDSELQILVLMQGEDKMQTDDSPSMDQYCTPLATCALFKIKCLELQLS